MIDTNNKIAQTQGAGLKMTLTSILLTIFTAALISATSLACSNATSTTETPTELPTASEQTQTTLPTSTPRLNTSARHHLHHKRPTSNTRGSNKRR